MVGRFELRRTKVLVAIVMERPTVLRLPAPFGLGDQSIHIAMRVPNHLWYQAGDIAEKFGCPTYVRPKVESCIRHSGRYDCLLRPDLDVDELEEALLDIGGSLETIDMCSFEYSNSAMETSLSYRILNNYGGWQIGISERGDIGFNFVVDFDALERDAVVRIAY
jgi:hypothetical protein